MQSKTLLSLLRIFLIVLGALGFLWGLYDMFGDGQQSSMGVKKMLGGIAFACISGFLLTWAINQVGSAESQAGISACFQLPVYVHMISNLIR